MSILLVLAFNYPDCEDRYVSGIFVKEQVNVLKQHFEKVVVISPLPYGAARLRGIRQEDYRYDNVAVYFPRFFALPGAIYYGGQLRIDQEYRAVRGVLLREVFRQGGHIDLVHAHMLWPSGAVAARLKPVLGVPLVITEHSSRTFRRELDRQNPVYLDALRACNTLIRPNHRDNEVFEPYCARVTTVPNGFSAAYYPQDQATARRQLGLPPDGEILYALGNLIPEKGFNHLIDAMALLDEDNVTCIIGGDGPERRNLQRQIERLNLTGRVQLCGHVPAAMAPRLMNACDLFVLPSLVESFGIVQIEALACGKPVVATYNGGSEEIIRSRDCGIRVGAGDAKSLAWGIRVALHRHRQHDWDAALIRQYAERYTWDAAAGKILEVYRDVGLSG